MDEMELFFLPYYYVQLQRSYRYWINITFLFSLFLRIDVFKVLDYSPEWETLQEQENT